MGHVVNPHLFRLNYTVFWNISTFSKKKFSIFIDLKSLIIYNFFNDYLNNYKNIRKIKLRILKIKISFYCNNIKIFFFFIKHKNLNRNFKKMFNNNFKLNKHYIRKLFYLNDSFLLNNDKYLFNENDAYQNIIYKEYNLNDKNNLFKNKTIDFKNLKKHYKQKKNYFFNEKKLNKLFVNTNEKNSDYSSYMDANRHNHFWSYKIKKISDFNMLFETVNKYKTLMNKNFAEILAYYYNFEYSKLRLSNFFTVFNYNMYTSYIERKIPFIPILTDDKREFFSYKEKAIAYVNREENKKIFNLNFKKLKFSEYVDKIISRRNRFNKNYKRFKKRRFEKFFKKSFFFINIKKKNIKYKNYFANKYFKLFYKKKKIEGSCIFFMRKYRFNYKKLRGLRVNNDIKKKKLFKKKKHKNFKKLCIKSRSKKQLFPKYASSINTTLEKNCFKFPKKRIKLIKKYWNEYDVENSDDLLDVEEYISAKKCIKKENCVNLSSMNLKLNLKIIKNKFLLFNFIKIFLKLKKKMYAVFNRIYLNNIAVIITICLKKYSRWKFTADYLNDLIIVRLKQSHRIKDIMKFIIKYLNRILRKKRIIGYAILLKGRFSRKDRAVYQLKRFGKTKKTNKVSIIDFSNKSVNLTYSKAAISIWVTRHI